MLSSGGKFEMTGLCIHSAVIIQPVQQTDTKWKYDVMLFSFCLPAVLCFLYASEGDIIQ